MNSNLSNQRQSHQIESDVQQLRQRGQPAYVGFGPFFSPFELSSRRLTGELIEYPWFIGRPSIISNIIFETAWQIKAKFYVEPPWKGERKFI